MTSSALAERPAGALLGDQRPRILSLPPSVSTQLGKDAVELAKTAGLHLDDWEAWFLEQALAERAGDRWAAFEVALLVSRQNGKGAVIEAVELAGLYLLDEQLILHSAHEYKTAAEAFLRVRALIENHDDFRRRAKKPRTSHGEEGIELLTGQRLRFVARTGGSGRGFSGDRVILDEAQHLGDSPVEALMPTMSARPNPQLWYTFTAPDKDLAPCGPVARLRRRALGGDGPAGRRWRAPGDPDLVYAEWSIDPHEEACVAGCLDHDDPAGERAWARANPGLGIRLTVEHTAREHASMSAAGFARERLGVGNWPADADEWAVITADQWAACLDKASQLTGVVAFAADATPSESSPQVYGSVAAAGRRPDGLGHVEVVGHATGTAWMVPRLVDLAETHQPCAVVIDPRGPAAHLVAPLKQAGFVPVAAGAPTPPGGKALLLPTTIEFAQACGSVHEAVTDARDLRHLGDPLLASALAGARQRPLGDSWAWARKSTSVDISPLVAVTLARYGHAARAHLAGEVALEGSLMA